jgi:hypothetical protein
VSTTHRQPPPQSTLASHSPTLCVTVGPSKLTADILRHPNRATATSSNQWALLPPQRQNGTARPPSRSWWGRLGPSLPTASSRSGRSVGQRRALERRSRQGWNRPEPLGGPSQAAWPSSSGLACQIRPVGHFGFLFPFQILFNSRNVFKLHKSIENCTKIRKKLKSILCGSC